MGFAYLSEYMILNKKSALVVVVLTIIGIAVVGWFLLSYQLQGRFGIYLLENNELVISDEDIVWYNRTSHEIKLTEVGVNKIQRLHVSLYGNPFVVEINGEKICNGSFVTPISSISPPPSEIVIETLIQNNAVKIQKGYPPSQFGAEDPRNNPKILDYFQNNKKLVQ